MSLVGYSKSDYMFVADGIDSLHSQDPMPQS